MKKIFELLYHGLLNEAERSIEPLLKTEEAKKKFECYEKIEKLLNEEQKEVLEEFLELEMAFINLQEERLYANGIKTGIWLGLELAEFNPKYYNEE